MTHRIGLVLLAVTTSVACSGRTLSAAQASLITALEQFKREAHFTIRTGVPLLSAFKCESQAQVNRAPNSIGSWWSADGCDTKRGRLFSASVRRHPCPAIALTPAGHAASAQWTRGHDIPSEGIAWAVPIGRRELIEVTGLTAAPDGSTQVGFDWKWTPNETGLALRKSVRDANVFFDQARKGRASCRQSDDDWRCQLGMWMSLADAMGESLPKS